MIRSFCGQHNGFGYRVTISTATTPPRTVVEIWCWKCLTYVTPVIHPWVACTRIRRISRRLGKSIPPVTVQEQEFHSTELLRIFTAVVSRVQGRHIACTCVSPYPIQIAEVSSTQGNSGE